MIPAVPRRTARAALAASLLLVTGVLTGQVPQEFAISERTLLPRDEIDKAVSESRYHLGRLYLTPVLAITQATYDSNIYGSTENPVGDFVLTVAGGLGVILPVGKSTFVRLAAIPAYTWYAQTQNRRFLGGQYGASVAAFTGPVTIGAGAAYSKSDVVFSSEDQARVIQEYGTANVDAEFNLSRRFYLYAQGRLQRFRYSGPGAPSVALDPSNTDRDTTLFLAEFRYRTTEHIRLSLGYQGTRADFVLQPQVYDNTTDSIVGGIYYDIGNVFLSVSGGYTEARPANGSTIVPFSGFIGGGSVSYAISRRLNVSGSARRSLSYGLSSPYYISNRYGGELSAALGWRTNLRAFGYVGDDRYSTPVPVAGVGDVYRVDDVTGYGGGFDFLVTSRLQLQFAATETRYNSNVPGYTRSYFRWVVMLSVGGNLLK